MLCYMIVKYQLYYKNVKTLSILHITFFGYSMVHAYHLYYMMVKYITQLSLILHECQKCYLIIYDCQISIIICKNYECQRYKKQSGDKRWAERSQRDMDLISISFRKAKNGRKKEAFLGFFYERRKMDKSGDIFSIQ